MKYLISAGADINDYELTKRFVDEFAPDRIIAADSGMRHVARMGLKADVLLGDLDSIDEALLDGCKDVRIIRANPEKDDTDTKMALSEAFAGGASDILVIGGIGSRFDHTYSNVLLLKEGLDRNVRIRLFNEHNEIELHGKSFELCGMKEKTVSFYSMFSDTAVTLKGFHYPLDRYLLKTSSPLGVSNVIEENRAEVIFEEGCIMSVIPCE